MRGAFCLGGARGATDLPLARFAQNPSAPRLQVVRETRRPIANDDDLLDAFERHDPRAAADLYDHLIPIVDSTLYRMLGERGQDHEDLVQTAFERIVHTLRRRRFARACSLTTWAAAITTRLALTTIRRRTQERRRLDRSHSPEDVLGTTPSGVNVEQQVVMELELERVRRHLGQMQEQHATTLVLYHALDLNLSEIAATQELSVSAAQSRLVRARAELKKRLLEDELGRDRRSG